MTSTFQSDENQQAKEIDRQPAGRLITKDSDHPLSAVALGEVVGLQFLSNGFLLFYADKHIAKIYIDDEGDLVFSDHEVPSC